MAVGAFAFCQEFRHTCQPFFVLDLRKRVFHGVHGAVVGEVHFCEGLAFFRLVQDVSFFHRAVEHDFALFGGELTERHVGAHAERAAYLFHEIPHKRAPRQHCALVDRKGLVGHERCFVHRAHDARPAARGAGAAAIEGQVLRARAEELRAALWADDGDAERDVGGRRHAMAVRADMLADAREQQSQVVQQLGRRAESRVHAGNARALSQSERGRHVQHFVHGSARCLGDAPSCVGGERVEIATGAFGIENAQGKRAFSRARYARDADQLVQRDSHVQVLQVVDARPAHFDGGWPIRVQAHGTSCADSVPAPKHTASQQERNAA